MLTRKISVLKNSSESEYSNKNAWNFFSVFLLSSYVCQQNISTIFSLLITLRAKDCFCFVCVAVLSFNVSFFNSWISIPVRRRSIYFKLDLLNSHSTSRFHGQQPLMRKEETRNALHAIRYFLRKSCIKM